jgi:hypothetical protein
VKFLEMSEETASRLEEALDQLQERAPLTNSGASSSSKGAYRVGVGVRDVGRAGLEGNHAHCGRTLVSSTEIVDPW